MNTTSTLSFRHLSAQVLSGIFLLFIASCSKNTNDDGEQPVPPVENNVSGHIKKMSFSTTPGYAYVSVFEKDNLGRIVSGSLYAEDSNGLKSTFEAKSVMSMRVMKTDPKYIMRSS